MNKRISDNRESGLAQEDLKTERRRARERMRWVEPETAGKVLGHYRYWTVQFLELYLERCDETAFDVPADAYLLAQHAPELAKRIRIGGEVGEYESATEKLSGIVMALAVKGSCCRVVDEPVEAELCFKRAFAGLQGRRATPVAMSELHRRYSALLAISKRTSEAMNHLSKSLDFCEEADHQPGIADALALSGYIHAETNPAKAVLDFIQATRHADGKSARGRRTVSASLRNILVTVAQDRRNISLRDQESALRVLKRYKSELKGTPTGMRKLKVLWIEGLLLSNLRIDRHARRQLSKARKGFLQLGLPLEYAVVSMELIQFLLRCGEPGEAQGTAEETLAALADRELSTMQVDIIREWSTKELSIEGTAQARANLVASNHPQLQEW